MQKVLNHVEDRSPHLSGKRRKIIKNFQRRSARGGYYTALKYDVIRDVFVLSTLIFVKVEVILFDTLV